MQSNKIVSLLEETSALRYSYVLYTALLLLFQPVQLKAQNQSIAPDLNGQELINYLQQNYSPTQTLGYDVARDTMYRRIDMDPVTNEVTGVYSGFTRTLDLNADPSTFLYDNNSSLSINAEHTWPQSKGAGTEPQRSDIHNLFPAKSNINSARNNDPLRDIDDNVTDTWYYLDQSQSTIPTTNINEYAENFGSTAFEPREVHKGNAARAVFYFYTIYQSVADDAFFELQKDDIYQWHKTDLVDAKEVSRSNKIAQYQGNNNPFVLDTSLVRRAFFSGDNGGGNNTNAAIVFSEIYYDATGSDAENEWIELYNPDSQSADISGYTITDNNGTGSTYSIPANTTIAPKTYVVIAASIAGFNSLHGIDPDLAGGIPALNNGGDALLLTDASGNVTDQVAWEGGASSGVPYNWGSGPSAATSSTIYRVDVNTDTDTSNDWAIRGNEGDPQTQATSNQVPTVTINGPYNGTVGQVINFNSAGSNDPDGNIVSYLWNFGDGGSSTSANPSYTYSTAGTFTVSLTVTDNDGGQNSDTSTTVITSVGNQSPIASINGPYNGTVGQAINFSSTGSNDPDGNIVSYLWDFGDGGSSSAANPSYAYNNAGTFTVTLTVTDNEGVQSSVSSSVVVTAPVSLLFTEVFYDTPGYESKEEWVEIYNPTNSAIDLSGYKLKDDNGNKYTYSFSSNTLIAPKSYFVIADDIAAFQNLYNGKVPDIEINLPPLNNGGDVLLLTKPDDTVLDQVSWEGGDDSNISGWGGNDPSAAEGESIYRLDVEVDTDTKNDWGVRGNNGDPQTQPYLLISEILYNENNSFSDEWIEIFNSTAEEIDLSGYQLKNQERGKKQVHLQIPSGYTIAANSYFVIAKSTDQSTFKSYYGFDADVYINWNGKDLGNGGEKIDLITPNGQTLDYVAWGNREPNGWGSSPSTSSNESLCRIYDYFYDTNTASDWQVCANGGDPTVQPSDNFTWNGSAGNAWNNGNNWEGGTAPGSTPNLDINIPATGNNPILSANLNLSGITLGISDNAQLTVANGGSLTIGNNGIVSTGNNAFMILNPGAEYINMSASDPTLRIEQEITGSKGWRMISSPIITGFDDLLSDNFVTQGFAGSDYPDKQPNLLWWDESEAGTTLQGWRTASDISDNTNLGRGYFHYVFDGAGVAGSSDTYSDNLPLILSVTGTEPNIEGSNYSYSNVSYTPRDTTSQSSAEDDVYIDRVVADQGFNLVGNPTASTLDWDAAGWSKTNISETIYIWDPAANNGNGDYLVWNGSNGSLGSGKIAPMQSFWVQAIADNPSLSFDNSVKTSSATFRGKMAAPKQEASENPSIKFSLAGEGFKKDLWITFSDNGKMGIDKWDAFQLNQMTESWLAFYSAFPGENNAAMTINHLPLNQTEDVTFLQLLTAIYSDHKPLEGECTLAWERSGEWPNHLNVYLQDDELQSKVKIGAVPDSISFYLRSPVLAESQGNIAYKNASKAPMIPVLPASLLYPSAGGATPSKMKTSSGPSNGTRFSVLISREALDEFLPTTPTLYQNYPNPFNPETTIQFSLPEKSNIKLQVFDILGREVAQLANGNYEAGVHRVRWDASRLSSGVYLYRLISDGQTIITKKMTLLK